MREEGHSVMPDHKNTNGQCTAVYLVAMGKSKTFWISFDESKVYTVHTDRKAAL